MVTVHLKCLDVDLPVGRINSNTLGFLLFGSFYPIEIYGESKFQLLSLYIGFLGY